MFLREAIAGAFLLMLPCAAWSAESRGHAGGKEPDPIELETELYLGHGGYWHGGMGVIAALADDLKLGLGGHAQREEFGASEVDYYNAELIKDFGGGLEVEGFTFVYPEVDRLQAVGLGLRATKTFEMAENREVALFFGPSYARGRSVIEETDALETMHHLMLVGGVTFEAGPVFLRLIGTHSFYNRDPEGVATHVGLTDMIHFAAYENNDGFVRDTAALEAGWEINEWLSIQVGYAAMWFEDETRHAISITPGVQVGERLEIEVGVEWLRGGEEENDLAFIGLTFAL